MIVLWMYGPVKDEWEVVPLRDPGVLYSNVNGDIRHGVHRGVGGLESSVCVCVCVWVEWEFHMVIYACFMERESVYVCACEKNVAVCERASLVCV